MCNEKSSLSTPLRLAEAEEDLVVPAYFTAYRSLRLTRDALGVLVAFTVFCAADSDPLSQNCARIQRFHRIRVSSCERSRFPQLLETLVVRRNGRSCWSREDVRPRQAHILVGNEALLS
jgi:hypothetical protein